MYNTFVYGGYIFCVLLTCLSYVTPVSVAGKMKQTANRGKYSKYNLELVDQESG